MEIKLNTNFPEKASDFLQLGNKLFRLPEEELYKLYFITLKIKTLSDPPLYKFLERTLPFIKFDEVGKKEFLLTLSIHTVRQLLVEHFDLKFTKNLYLFLQERLPIEFFKGCAPKREVVTSKDLSFYLLTLKEKAELPPYLKVKHLILIFQLTGTCEEILRCVPYLGLYALKRWGESKYELFAPLSISDFVYLSQEMEKRGLIERIVLEVLMKQLKGLFPDCFGEF